MSDLELLQQYARTNSQDAFAALVTRHLDLVYSAAHRQVRSPHLAEEVAQSVFVDLARNVARLSPAQPLAAWLFVVTRRTAVDVVRRESRRQAREQIAAELAAMENSSRWSQVKDRLDEAMESLSDTDRAAILLRFFENRSLREVGTALGLSEDTAQKRVRRALDRLRSLLSRRGIATSAATLATDLSAHAVEAAPPALGATLSSTSFFTAHVAGLARIVSPPVSGWSALQKTAAAAAAAGVLGVFVFEGFTIARQRDELASVPERSAQLTATLAKLQAAHARATGRIQSARTELAEASRPRVVDAELEAAIEAWLAREQRMKTLAAERADLRTPEFETLTEREWFAAAKEAKLESESQISDTFRILRGTARESFAGLLDEALARFVTAHDGNLPDYPEQLAAFAAPPLPPDLLRDYEMLRRGPRKDVPPDAWLLAESTVAAARHGNRVFVSQSKRGTEDLTASSPSTP